MRLAYTITTYNDSTFRNTSIAKIEDIDFLNNNLSPLAIRHVGLQES